MTTHGHCMALGVTMTQSMPNTNNTHDIVPDVFKSTPSPTEPITRIVLENGEN